MAQRIRPLGCRTFWILALLGVGGPWEVRSAPPASDGLVIKLESGHPWRPPFDLDRVGQPVTVVIESSQPPRHSDYLLTVFQHGKEVGRHPVNFTTQPPCSATITIPEYGDEIVLTARKANESGRIELTRQPIRIPSLELDAAARPDSLINPVDMGTILVPHGWLLLGPGQSGVLDLAAICRDKDEPQTQVRATYGSAPGSGVTAPLPLQKGRKQRISLQLPEPSKTLDRDVLHVALVDGRGDVLGQKSIPVMLVQQPPSHPRFGATYTRLRYDAPISVRDPGTGTFSSLKYQDGWNKALQDVVVSFPSGARFVFWRGSSYIPFWAGRHNTGACYEWAEIITRLKGAVDCVEPLMDKELRYGRVEIVESTAARVHVRWTYQSTDLHYNVWGDEAVEDYFFYPDGFGTRVLTLKSDPATDYEISEFIILTPQGAYPFDVLPESLVDMIGLDGRKWSFRFPSQAGEFDEAKKAMGPKVYRLRLHKQESASAIYFNPLDLKFPEVIFTPFSDRGQIVTPCYWGSHWPLARGNATGNAIDERIALTPCHNSVMSWARIKPEPVRAGQLVGLDAQGKTRLMSFRRWVWLIGMSDASDGDLGDRATSFAFPSSLAVQGGRLDFDSYDPQRRALRVHVQDRKVTIQLKPRIKCVNPVFELLGAPDGPLTVARNGFKMSPDSYAWDGRTLWLDATIREPAELRLEFSSSPALSLPASGQP